MYDENVQIEFLQFEAKLASLTYGNPCLRNIVSNNENVLFILCNDQAQVRGEVDQVEGTKHQYANMKTKRKIRKLFYDTNMSAQIVVDFKSQIKEGPFYIYIICNHCLYKISYILFKKKITMMQMRY